MQSGCPASRSKRQGGLLRSALAGGLALAGLVAGLACTAPERAPIQPGPPPLPSPTPVVRADPGRVIVAGEPPVVASRHPGEVASAVGMQYHWPVHDGLTWVTREGEVQPGLATAWRSLDGRTWEFDLGAWRFSDGRLVTARDVVNSLDYYRDPANRLPLAATFLNVDEVAVAEGRPGTVRVLLKQVDPRFPVLAALAMVIPVGLTPENPEPVARSGIGTGPYLYAAQEQPGRVIYLGRGADTVTPRGPAPVRELEIRFLPDSATRSAALRSGEADIAYPLAPTAAVGLREQGYQVQADPGFSTVSFLPDPYRPPTSDVRVRQALNLAVDRATLLKTTYAGFGALDGQLLGYELPGFNPEVFAPGYDPTEARTLLARAGYPLGFQTTMTVTRTVAAGRDVGEAVAADLARVGVHAQIVVEEPAVWVAQGFGPATQRPGLWVQQLAWDTTYGPQSTWRWYSSDVPLNGGRRWADPVFDRLYQEARGTIDPERRTALYQQAAVVLNQQAGAIFLWRVARPAAWNRTVVWDPGLDASMWVSRLRRPG